MFPVLDFHTTMAVHSVLHNAELHRNILLLSSYLDVVLAIHAALTDLVVCEALGFKEGWSMEGFAKSASNQGEAVEDWNEAPPE